MGADSAKEGHFQKDTDEKHSHFICQNGKDGTQHRGCKAFLQVALPEQCGSYAQSGDQNDTEVACGRAGEGKRKKDEIGIASLRMGNVVCVHEVHICTPSQTLTLRHQAETRGMLADGAVDAARFMVGKKPGLYNMEDLLAEAR